jgi:hypothetical protein
MELHALFSSARADRWLSSEHQEGNRIMTPKMIIVAIALLMSATSAALAQANFTTGSAGSDAAAGYPSSSGYGTGLYAYAPGYTGLGASAPGHRYSHIARDRQR